MITKTKFTDGVAAIAIKSLSWFVLSLFAFMPGSSSMRPARGFRLVVVKLGSIEPQGFDVSVLGVQRRIG